MEDDSDIEFTDSEEEFPLMEVEQAAGGGGPEQALANLRNHAQVDENLRGILNAAVGMQPLWRMRRPLANNELLVEQLVKDGIISKKEVEAAMKCCPRDQFVPGGQEEHPDVFADSPMRLGGLGFNVSAPHIHASCLEALDLQPGHRVLDVGCGSGLLSAYAAHMVGKRGRVVGVDVKLAATKLSRDNLARQVASNSNFAQRAAPCEFHTHNVFLPGHPFAVGFDRIVAGASAPSGQLNRLLGLLKEGGGVIVTPVIPSDLDKITKLPDGSVKTSLISKVRFSDLVVPKDGEIIKAVLDTEREAFLQPPLPASTFASDVASITGGSSGSLPGSSVESGQIHFPADSPSPSLTWAHKGATFLACGSFNNSSGDMDTQDGGPTPSPVPPSLGVEELGPYDCQLVGSNWTLPAHMCVLRTRCDLFRAQSASGMRDASATQIRVPEEFPKEAVAAFLRFCATDQLDEGITPREVEVILSVANFYGNDYLVQLCELALVSHLRGLACGCGDGSQDQSDAPGLAASFLALAEENGLPHLLAVSLDFILHQFPAVAQTQAYEELSKQQVDLIAKHACGQHSLVRAALKEVA